MYLSKSRFIYLNSIYLLFYHILARLHSSGAFVFKSAVAVFFNWHLFISIIYGIKWTEKKKKKAIINTSLTVTITVFLVQFQSTKNGMLDLILVFYFLHKPFSRLFFNHRNKQ